MYLEREVADKILTPAYLFDKDEFAKRVRFVKGILGPKIPLCFSIKSNPFLLEALPEEIDMVEVCSPGELTICQNVGIAPERIIYSGVMKEQEDVERAVSYQAGILTAESRYHVEIENKEALRQGQKKKVILRLSSGNQFGMSEEDMMDLISRRKEFKGLDFVGLHYYSGTQKKKRAVERDLKHLGQMADKLKEQLGFCCEIIEYGPGLFVNYFKEPYEEADMQLMEEVGAVLRDFSEKYPLSIEMGRFLAASCGAYITEVKDIKKTEDITYLICDGGMHHLKYHGQTMAMQVPPIQVLSKEENYSEAHVPYTICGSLCTVADVLVREAFLEPLKRGDRIAFLRSGAYSVSEGSLMFLSRTMPRIYMKSEEEGLVCIRDFIQSDRFHVSDEVRQRRLAWD